MCRLAGYLGPEITLGHFLLHLPHGLMEQSWAPREMQEARLNADGYGFGWYTDDGQIGTYSYPMPIWTDVNLESLGISLKSAAWLANVRSATRLMAIHHDNTMPFTDGTLLFMHNGFVDDFGVTLRPKLRDELSSEFESDVQGTTDSEYIFALLRQIIVQDPRLTIGDAMRRLAQKFTAMLGTTKALLNLVVGNGSHIYALRHAIHGDCPSLYYSTRIPRFPGGQLIASEPLTDRDDWDSVPEHSLITLESGREPVIEPL